MEIIIGQLSIWLSIAKHIFHRYNVYSGQHIKPMVNRRETCNGLGNMQFIGYSMSWPKVDIGIECNIIVDKIFV